MPVVAPGRPPSRHGGAPMSGLRSPIVSDLMDAAVTRVLRAAGAAAIVGLACVALL